MKRARRGLVIPGAASHGATLGGAIFAVDELVDVVRVAGTSVGAALAAALAFAVPEQRVISLMLELLTGNGALDWGSNGRFGICRWDRIRAAVRAVVGDVTLGDALIPLHIVACDSYARAPVEFSSRATPHVLVHEAVVASTALWPLADMQEVPSFGTGNRLFFDGGYARNCPADSFRGEAEPSIVLSLQRNTDGDLIPVRTMPAAVVGVLETMLWASNHAEVDRDRDLVVDIDAVGSSLDFDLDARVVAARWRRGRTGVVAAATSGRLTR